MTNHQIESPSMARTILTQALDDDASRLQWVGTNEDRDGSPRDAAEYYIIPDDQKRRSYYGQVMRVDYHDDRGVFRTAYVRLDTRRHLSGCSCGSQECPEWIAAQQGECE